MRLPTLVFKMPSVQMKICFSNTKFHGNWPVAHFPETPNSKRQTVANEVMFCVGGNMKRLLDVM